MISALKSSLKSQAEEIRITRKDLKKFQQENNGWDGNFYSKLKGLVYKFRHHHIAYCLLKGTSYEAVEKPRQGNEPCMQLVQEIQHEFSQDVHISA